MKGWVAHLPMTLSSAFLGGFAQSTEDAYSERLNDVRANRHLSVGHAKRAVRFNPTSTVAAIHESGPKQAVLTILLIPANIRRRTNQPM
jgi:hypothetical protein